MSIWAIAVCMIMYLWISFVNFKDKDYPHSFIWFSYALSQGGFLWYEFIKKNQIGP